MVGVPHRPAANTDAISTKMDAIRDAISAKKDATIIRKTDSAFSGTRSVQNGTRQSVERRIGPGHDRTDGQDTKDTTLELDRGAAGAANEDTQYLH